MLSAVCILLLTFLIVFFIPNYRTTPRFNPEQKKNTPQVKKLWSLAQSAMRERKPLKAEKALLTILKFDEKNAAAYNRLGILYAREKHYKEALECFEIAQSLDNNASSLHNVGLIYLETEKYEKAAQAFNQALALEGDQPGRYVAYAKALDKLGQRTKAIEQLEIAYGINPSTVILRHILEIYENAADEENIAATKKRIENFKAETPAAKLRSRFSRQRSATKKTKTTTKSSTASRQKSKTTASASSSKPTKTTTKTLAITPKSITRPIKKLPKNRKII